MSTGAAHVLVWSAVGITAVGALATYGHGAQARAQAETAADLAALASADALAVGRSDPCAIAEHTARLNDAAVVQCVIDGRDVLVEVSVNAPVVPAQRARARAGPDPTGPPQPH